MSPDATLWTIFGAVVLVVMALDFRIFNRQTGAISFKTAAAWTGLVIALALGFAGAVASYRGTQAALEFLTGYLIEESLSLDNLFLFLLIFTYFSVPSHQQHEVLFWGVLGAMIMRAVFIVAGVALLHTFHWVIYVFGAILIFSGLKLGFQKQRKIEPEKNPLLRLFRRLVPVTKEYAGDRFFVRCDARIWATPLFLVLLVVETTDLVFALDSIPAVLAITDDKLIIYTSNIFAILGLRALYFALKGAMDHFHHLHYGLCAVLVFIGVKMSISYYWPIPTVVALGVVAVVFALSIMTSLIWPRRADDS